MTRDKFIVQASLERSRAKMAGSTSLVNQFDEIIAATDVLCAGSEGGEFDSQEYPSRLVLHNLNYVLCMLFIILSIPQFLPSLWGTRLVSTKTLKQ